MKLAEIRDQGIYIVEEIQVGDRKSVSLRLAEMGFVKGTKVRLVRKGILPGSLSLFDIRGTRVGVGTEESRCITVISDSENS